MKNWKQLSEEDVNLLLKRLSYLVTIENFDALPQEQQSQIIQIAMTTFDKFTYKQKEVIDYMMIVGATIKQVAKSLGLTYHAVHHRVWRARRMMIKEFNKYLTVV